MEKRKELWRALPFVMALLLLTLVPVQSASAILGRGKEETKAVEGAPVAENMAIRVYRGVAAFGVAIRLGLLLLPAAALLILFLCSLITYYRQYISSW